MSKAIYGLAMPFNDSYYEFNRLTNTFIFERTNKESVTLWKEVDATIGHNYDKLLGNTKNNLKVVIHKRGIFFRLKPRNRLGYETYGRVSRKELKHCSVTYYNRYSTDRTNQGKCNELAKLMNWEENIIVRKYDDVLITEVCLTNYPANKNTFCTTNKHDSRLKGVEFD